MELTGLHHDTVSMLLRLNKFNKEKVIESLVEKKTEFLESHRVHLWETFFSTHSIDLSNIVGDLGSFINNPYIKAASDPDTFSEILCGVCFDTPLLSHVVVSPCGHTFCLDCWIGYIQSEITTFKKATRMCCMEPSCKQYLPDTQIKSIIFASLLLHSNPNDIPADAFEDVSTFNTQKPHLSNITLSTTTTTTTSTLSTSGDLFSPLSTTSHHTPTISQSDRQGSFSSNSQSNLLQGEKSKFARFAKDEQKYNGTPSSSPRVTSSQQASLPSEDLLLPESTTEAAPAVIPVEKLWSKYCSLLRKAYSDDKRTLKYCPNPNCNMVIKGNASTLTAECICGITMCFRCNYEEDHAPVSCENLVIWLERCNKDSETAQWIMFNTRKCPKCYTRIEKNAGCNHMTCTNCNHEFCWVCDGAWSDHLKDAKNITSAYRCNRFDVKKNISNEQVDDKKIIEERDSQRYFFYFSRYHAMNSMKQHAISMRPMIERHKKQLINKRENPVSAYDAQALVDGNETLINVRRLLQFSYAYLFLRHATNEEERRDIELFEYLQERLEQSVEKLYELVYEKNMNLIQPSKIRNTVSSTKETVENLLAQYYYSNK